MDVTDSQPTPPPWYFTGDSLTGPPRAHPHDPQSRVYSPATIVAHLPADFGGAYRYYPPGQRDANGRMLAAVWDMLRFLHRVAALHADAPADPVAAAVAAGAREILCLHGLDRIVMSGTTAPVTTPAPTTGAGTVEIAGITFETCSGGARIHPAQVRKALPPLVMLAVFGRLNELGVPLLDSGVDAARVRQAVEHVAGLLAAVGVPLRQDADAENVDDTVGEQRADRAGGTAAGVGAWARDLAQAYSSGCPTGEAAVSGLANELAAVLLLDTEVATACAGRLLRAVQS